MNNKAFSLIELIVVIAIVGIIAAIAVPSYKNYIVRSNLTAVYSQLQSFQQGVVTQYQTSGSLPASPSFSGTTLIPSNNVSVTANGIIALNYRRLPTDTGGSLNGVAIIATLNSTFSSYCGSGSCQIRMAAIADANGMVTNYCGQWTPGGGSSEDISFTYLPSTCNCTNFINMWVSGVIGGGSGLNSC